MFIPKWINISCKSLPCACQISDDRFRIPPPSRRAVDGKGNIKIGQQDNRIECPHGGSWKHEESRFVSEEYR